MDMGCSIRGDPSGPPRLQSLPALCRGGMVWGQWCVGKRLNHPLVLFLLPD